MRTCKKCGVEKELEEFRGKKQGTVCWECLNTYSKKCAAEWRQANRAYRNTLKFNYNRYVSSAKKRDHAFNLTFEEFSSFWQQPCTYCGDQIDTVGIDRIDSTIGYEIGNCVACCTICNRMKWALTKEEWFSQLKKIVKHSHL